MGPMLHETRMGCKLIESDIPRIADALERIADALEKNNDKINKEEKDKNE